jgi:hypothetical protein
MVVLDADPSISPELARARVVVRGGPEGALEVRHDSTVAVGGLPLVVAIVPRDGDASRRIELEATALAAGDGTVLGVVRASTGFVAGRTVELALRFEECCRSVSCGPGQTCRDCGCRDDDVDPTLLPEHGRDAAAVPDAGLPDAPLPGEDAWTRPVIAEGGTCDLAAVVDVCAAGTHCTCTGLRGCGGSAEPPRCWATRDTGCGRPIDLTERIMREPRVRISGDGAGAPDVIAAACYEPVGEVVYLIRGFDSRTVLLESDVGMEFFLGSCGPSLRWTGCMAPWSHPLSAGQDMYVLLETDGPYTLRVSTL